MSLTGFDQVPEVRELECPTGGQASHWADGSVAGHRWGWCLGAPQPLFLKPSRSQICCQPAGDSWWWGETLVLRLPPHLMLQQTMLYTARISPSLWSAGSVRGFLATNRVSSFSQSEPHKQYSAWKAWRVPAMSSPHLRHIQQSKRLADSEQNLQNQ